MNKSRKLLSLLMFVLVMCGCSMKAEYDMAINEDKSMDFTVIAAYDNELIDAMISMQSGSEEQKEYTDEERWAMLDGFEKSEEEDTVDPEEYGFKLERYSEGEYKGFKYTKRIPNIDDISGTTANFNLDEFQNISDNIVFVKDGNKYKANIAKPTEETDTQGYNVGVEMIFKVTLPSAPISHNATSVSEDGKTLTWNLVEEGINSVEFEFSIDSKKNTSDNKLIYIGVLSSVVVISGISIAVMLNGAKKKEN